MKAHILSDLHLEFGPYPLRISGECLLLAGDTIVANHIRNQTSVVRKHIRPNYGQFFKAASENFDRVFLIRGNHEYYYEDYSRVPQLMEEYLSQWANITMLENQSVELVPGWRLWGSTLWTDFHHNPLWEIEAMRNMSDFEVIHDGKNRFTAARSADICRDSQRQLREALSSHPSTRWVVMTHHAPSGQSVSPRFRGSPLNPAFHSDLDELIHMSPEISYWIHGHMHNPSDYVIGSTRIICNPRGYSGHERVDGFRPELTIDLETP